MIVPSRLSSARRAAAREKRTNWERSSTPRAGELICFRSSSQLVWSDRNRIARKGRKLTKLGRLYLRRRVAEGTVGLVETGGEANQNLLKVEARLAELLPPTSRPPVRLHEAMRYAALAPGKRLRPALTMASCQAVGGNPLLGLDIGCAIELIHCFSLIHDDLPCIDDDDLRRGRPTCHKEFGEGLALLAGDALFALAFLVGAECSDNPAVTSAIVARLARASGSDGLVGGEVMDILAEGKPQEIESMQVIHAKKTGALIAASCVCGAILGGATTRQIHILEQFGEAIGLAFQIHDDILNETSSAEELGKAVGTDRQRQKSTYPSIFGLKRSRELADIAIQGAVQLIDVPDIYSQELHRLAIFSVQRSS